MVPCLWFLGPRFLTKRVVRVLSEGVCRPSGSWFLIPGTLILAAGCGRSSAIERLVPVSCAGCPASTSGLSTWWSTTALNETWF